MGLTAHARGEAAPLVLARRVTTTPAEVASAQVTDRAMGRQAPACACPVTSVMIAASRIAPDLRPVGGPSPETAIPREASALARQQGFCRLI